MEQNVGKWVPRDLGDIKQELGLPEDAECVGFVVQRESDDAFLMATASADDANMSGWAPVPSFARIYESHLNAKADADKTGHECLVGLLFDIGDAYYVAIAD